MLNHLQLLIVVAIGACLLGELLWRELWSQLSRTSLNPEAFGCDVQLGLDPVWATVHCMWLILTLREMQCYFGCTYSVPE